MFKAEFASNSQEVMDEVSAIPNLFHEAAKEAVSAGLLFIQKIVLSRAPTPHFRTGFMRSYFARIVMGRIVNASEMKAAETAALSRVGSVHTGKGAERKRSAIRASAKGVALPKGQGGKYVVEGVIIMAASYAAIRNHDYRSSLGKYSLQAGDAGAGFFTKVQFFRSEIDQAIENAFWSYVEKRI